MKSLVYYDFCPRNVFRFYLNKNTKHSVSDCTSRFPVCYLNMHVYTSEVATKQQVCSSISKYSQQILKTCTLDSRRSFSWQFSILEHTNANYSSCIHYDKNADFFFSLFCKALRLFSEYGTIKLLYWTRQHVFLVCSISGFFAPASRPNVLNKQ